MIEPRREGVPHDVTGSVPGAVEATLRADRVSKVYGSGDGVHDVTLEVPPSSIFGFIGPSGSGKTTMVRLLTGVVAPSSGSLTVLGRDPARFDRSTRARLGYMPQRSVLYPEMSVEANLRFFASLYGMDRGHARKRIGEQLDLVQLADHRRKRVDRLSGGMQRRLSLAATLVHDPEVILLDEPTAGIDPLLRRRLWDRFAELRDEGRTLFVTTQYVGEAAYCDRVGVLSDGRLVVVGTPDELRREAFGGDVVDVEFTEPPPHALLLDLAGTLGADGWERVSLRRVRLVVDEAATALPQLSAMLAAQDVEVAQAEEYLPPFDDVFVELVERHRAETQDEEAA